MSRDVDSCTRDHDGHHVTGVQCPDYGRFVSDGWDTGWFYTDMGGNQRWGGVCRVHGQFSESAA